MTRSGETTSERVEAVLFDLDDTLFPQESWLAGAWADVARAAAPSGADGTALLAALLRIAAEGSARGGIVDRALLAVGAGHVPVGPLVDAFQAHDPGVLELYPGVASLLPRLRAAVPLGLVSDGDVDIQRGKLKALALEASFDVVVWSDELGRDRRKPSPAPFLRALELLGRPAARVVFVGDRPDKDVAGAQAVGMRAIRVRSGEYALDPDVVTPWASAATAAEAIEFLLHLVA